MGPTGTRGGDLADDRYGFSIKTGIRTKVTKRDGPTCISFFAFLRACLSSEG